MCSQHTWGTCAAVLPLLKALLLKHNAMVQCNGDADTMDVYVATTGKVRLMDFNPIGGFTAPLLFDWDQLGYGECMLH